MANTIELVIRAREGNVRQTVDAVQGQFARLSAAAARGNGAMQQSFQRTRAGL